MKNLMFVLLLILSAPLFAQESSNKSVIAMASEAAPDNVTDNAAIMKFQNGDFYTIREGKNNFTCMVISDPQGRYEPSCFNEEAMRSVFPTYQYQMAMLYKGKSHAEVSALIESEFKKGNLPTAEHGALVYMMSPNNKGFNPETKALEPTPIHQMYYYPKLTNKTFSLSSKGVFMWQGYPHLTALIVVIDDEGRHSEHEHR